MGELETVDTARSSAQRQPSNPGAEPASLASRIRQQKTAVLAVLAAAAILVHLVMRFVLHTDEKQATIPLLTTLVLGGLPFLWDLGKKLCKREFGSDLLGGISIITSVLLGEYLVGSIIVLMLAGGDALETHALRNASSVLKALARRMPSVAHRKEGSKIVEIPLKQIAVDDSLVIYPHETCPADGVVTDGHGVMDESYLTGEPFKITKTLGSTVLSGAINGDSALTLRVTRRADDSRYAKIMAVMRESEQKRPRLRRLGDRIGAVYTPVALTIGLLAWIISGDPVRFLAVLVIATPCPLLIGIPVAIIGSISLCARKAIIVKTPLALEQVSQCRTAIFDKTGTLTYGEPVLTEQYVAPGFTKETVMSLVASVERYSKHPLARAIVAAVGNKPLPDPTEVSEQPGLGLRGTVEGHQVQITSRERLLGIKAPGAEQLPPASGGLECVVLVDGRYAALLKFRDAPRAESRSFVAHLMPKHRFIRMMLLSGDRESEVRYLANEVGIRTILSGQSPEDKLEIVRKETAAAKTLYVGDGINDAPAMMAATVGMAIGQNSDVTAEAADVVVMDNSLTKVDEFMHISRRMRMIALQSALGGMALSVIGMAVAAAGHLSPVAGAVSQEVIDVFAVLNALRAALPPKVVNDL